VTELNKQIEYLFKLVDNVSSSAGQMAQSLDEAGQRVDANMVKQEELQRSVEATGAVLDGQQVKADQTSTHLDSAVEDMRQTMDILNAEVDVASAKQGELRDEMLHTQTTASDTQISLLTQLTAVMSLKEGVSAVSNGLISLGIVSSDAAQALSQVNAAFSLMAGAVSTLKSIQAVMTTVNAASAIGAAIDTYRATLANPAMLGAVALASGAAIGVAGAYLMSNNTTNNSTTVNIVDTTPAQAQSEILQVVTGGAL
jgi:hypothetical protein